MTAQQRFDLCVTVAESGCWQWSGYVDPQGYGRLGFEGRRSVLAHVVSWTLHVGPVPDGHELDHVCHTRSDCPGGSTCEHRRCVNPEHLEPVTRAENTYRGRSFSAVNRTRTHCPHGHPYDEENTLVSNGRRYCRICQRAHAMRTQAKARAS